MDFSLTSSILMAFVVFLVWLLALWLVKRIVFRRLKKWAARDSFVWDDLIVVSLEAPVNWVILGSGLILFAEFLPLSSTANQILAVAFKGFVVFAIVLFADSLIRNLATQGVSAGKVALSSGVVRGLLRGFILGLGSLIFLQLIGISITPILASLGIGSLAVALALQDMLSNFFAGVYVSVDKPVQIGDFIRLESGDEGCVSDIGWRNTRVRTPANNIVIIPNSKLISSVLTNYSVPNREMTVVVDISVAHDSDLARVERAALEAGRLVLKNTLGTAKDFEPLFFLSKFTETGIQGSVVMRAREFADAGIVKSDLVKALHAKFREAGIVLSKSYPVKVLSADSASATKGP